MSVRILDGAMGEAIFEALGSPAGGWSMLAAVDHFDVVENLHAAYLRAGAQVITTATYQLGRWRMNRADLGSRFGEINRAAAHAADSARELVNPGALVAGSIGPVRDSYDASKAPPPDVIEREVLEQALTLAPEVDLFLCETMSASPEAFASLKAAMAANKPVWVALTVHEMGPSTMRSGERVGAVAERLYERGAEAVLINCTAPEQVDPALEEIAAVAGGQPFGAYANAFLPTPPEYGLGETVDHPGMRTDLDPLAYAAHVMRWVSLGATIVGGCCGVGPEHIEAVEKRVRGMA